MAGIRSQKSLVERTFPKALFVYHYRKEVFMDETYGYTTTKQQIEKLESQKLKIDDRTLAERLLNTYGYYNIINGYRDPYITREYDKKYYTKGITFEQLFQLFIFDHTIRDSISLAMIDLEEHLRAIVADIIAESFGTDHNVYLRKNNYRDKRTRHSHFSRNAILDKLKKNAEECPYDPIKYYRNKYHVVPPWILMKGTYFNTLVNFTRFFKKNERDKLVSTLFGNKVNNDNIEDMKDLLSDVLFMCLEYRNLAAHGGRVYNYVPKASLRACADTNIQAGLHQLVYALDQFDYNQPFERVKNSINHALTNYCKSFPDDLIRLEKVTGLKIEVHTKVWINENTRKYHSKRHCSGSNLERRVDISIAEDEGYAPCQKCAKNIVSVI